ncbi:MAG: DUF447 domain-containing protein [Candidatus Heimdallarchaeota archaeon]
MKDEQPAIDTWTVYEAIVTTYNEDGSSNAATMGIIQTMSGEILIKPFKETDTHKNLVRANVCVINYSLDPELYVKSSLFQEEFSADEFIESKHVLAPILKVSQNNHIALEVLKRDETSEELKTIFVCKAKHYNYHHNKPAVFTRAFSSLIEILIHATRIIAFQDQPKKTDEIQNLRSLIEHYSKIIMKVTQKNSYYQVLLEKIQRKINQDNTSKK